MGERSTIDPDHQLHPDLEALRDDVRERAHRGAEPYLWRWFAEENAEAMRDGLHKVVTARLSHLDYCVLWAKAWAVWVEELTEDPDWLLNEYDARKDEYATDS